MVRRFERSASVCAMKARRAMWSASLNLIIPELHPAIPNFIEILNELEKKPGSFSAMTSRNCATEHACRWSPDFRILGLAVGFPGGQRNSAAPSHCSPLNSEPNPQPPDSISRWPLGTPDRTPSRGRLPTSSSFIESVTSFSSLTFNSLSFLSADQSPAVGCDEPHAVKQRKAILRWL